MVSILGLVGITVIISVFGLIGGYFIWVKTRPKKMTWLAKVYHLGEGVIPPLKDKDGIIKSDLKLRELIPYTKDVLERVEKEKGLIVYRLVKLNRTVPAVQAENIDDWRYSDKFTTDGMKEVSVIIDGESCTLLKKGYDFNGRLVFRPMPYDRLNMMTNEIIVRKDRLTKERDILQALVPYVAIIVGIIGLVAMAWVLGKSMVEMSENNKLAQENHDKVLQETTDQLAKVLAYYQPQKVTPVVQPPPSVE